MKIGSAAGLGSRQAQHGHDRDFVKDNDADIGSALISVSLEARMFFDPVFDHGGSGQVVFIKPAG